jgi:hypothetical protein
MEWPVADWFMSFDIRDEESGGRIEDRFHTLNERGERMLKKIGIWVLVLGLSFALFAGCARVQYRKMYTNDEARLQSLKDMGGEEKAPYETAKAEGYLGLMKHELDENDFESFTDFKEKFNDYHDQALGKVQ